MPNQGRARPRAAAAEGMALAIEPMLTLGSPGTRLLDDGWTVVTEDGSLAAHFEHTVAITADGPWVLTAADGGRGRASRGWPGRGGSGPPGQRFPGTGALEQPEEDAHGQ